MENTRTERATSPVEPASHLRSESEQCVGQYRQLSGHQSVDWQSRHVPGPTHLGKCRQRPGRPEAASGTVPLRLPSEQVSRSTRVACARDGSWRSLRDHISHLRRTRRRHRQWLYHGCTRADALDVSGQKQSHRSIRTASRSDSSGEQGPGKLSCQWLRGTARTECAQRRFVEAARCDRRSQGPPRTPGSVQQLLHLLR